MRHNNSCYAIFKIVIDTTAAFALILGGILGYYALNEYKRANEENQIANTVQANNTLYVMDRDIYDPGKAREHLEPFWAQVPKNFKPRDRARERIKLLLGDYSQDNWKNIAEFNCIMLYSPEAMRKPQLNILRDCTGLAERILYLLYAGFDHFTNKLIDEKDYDTWLAYLKDIGDHPIFLAALYNGHFMGYLDPEFCNLIKNKMVKIPWVLATINEIYPEMLEPGWADCAGKMGQPACPYIPHSCRSDKK